jgi:hypothetical protein
MQVRSIDGMERIAVDELVLFREPATGLSLSVAGLLQNYRPLAEAGHLLANTAVSIDGGVMRAFSFGGLALLLIPKSQARYPSMDAAQAPALADIADYLHSDHQPWLWSKDAASIRLWNRLPKSVTDRSDDRPLPATRLSGLVRSGRCWHMTIDGPASEVTPVFIDQSYDLADADSCAQPPPRIPHVQLVPGAETKIQAAALRNNRPSTIELHYRKARVTYHDGETSRLRLFMFYDPGSGLFWWSSWSIDSRESDSDDQAYLRLFLDGTSIYITAEQIVAFSNSTIRSSTERYPNFQAGQSHVLSVLDAMRGNVQIGETQQFRALDKSGIPVSFFDRCFTAFTPEPQLTSIVRSGGVWQLTLLGANGNSAVLTLNDKFETAGVKLSPEVPAASIEQVIRSETVPAQRDGQAIDVDLREVQVRHPTCGGTTLSKVVLLFDPSSHFSWWRELNSDRVFDSAIYETDDRIAAFSSAMPYIEIQESGERLASWGELQSHVLGLAWRGIFKSYLPVDLRGHLPEEFVRRPLTGPFATPRVSRTGDRWRISLTGSNGQTAIVELDSSYQLLRAELQP